MLLSGVTELPWNLDAIASYSEDISCGAREVQFFDADSDLPIDPFFFEDLRDEHSGNNTLRFTTTDRDLQGTYFNTYFIVTDVVFHNMLFQGSILDRQARSPTFSIQVIELCTVATGVSLPSGGPFSYEYILSDNPIAIDKMTSAPYELCKIEYTYEVQDVSPKIQKMISDGFSGWDPPTFSLNVGNDLVGTYTIIVTGGVNGATNSFQFELDLMTSCDREAFVSIAIGALPVDPEYIITDFSESNPYRLSLPRGTADTLPFRHDWCGEVDLQVFF